MFDPNESKKRVEIVKRFQFNSELQRMSVIVQRVGQNNELRLFSKGSPEIIQALCHQNTVPPNFEKILNHYTSQGCYVLAIAYSEALHAEKDDKKKLVETHRKQLERNLNFGGFLVFKNQLKQETKRVIGELMNAAIDVVMITGDHLQSGLHVAGECGMLLGSDRQNKQVFLPLSSDCSFWKNAFINVNEEQVEEQKFALEEILKMCESEDIVLAISGQQLEEFEAIYLNDDTQNIKKSQIYSTIMNKTKIFGRISPSQKTGITEFFIEQKYFVGMCGDGVNDCD